MRAKGNEAAKRDLLTDDRDFDSGEGRTDQVLKGQTENHMGLS